MSESRPDCPFLAECVDVYRAATTHAEGYRSELSDAQLTWKPSEEEWSIVECLEHLNITVSRQIEKMRVGALDGRSQGKMGGSPPYGKGTFFGRFLIKSMLPDSDRKFSTFKTFNPIHSTLDPDEVIERFKKTNSELVRVALEADGVDLGRVKVGSAPTNLFKMSLAQAFRVHVLHHNRHLYQADRLRKKPEFPK